MRLIIATLRARRATSALLFLLAVLAVAVGAAAPLYADVAARSVRQFQYESADGAERAITVRGSMPLGGGADSIDGLRTTVESATAGRGLTTITSMELVGTAENGAAEKGTADKENTDKGKTEGASGHVALVARDGACAHLRVRGRCATGAGEAVVSEIAAGILDLRPGSTLVARTPVARERIRLAVVGVYRPVDTAEPYWAGRADLEADPRREAAPLFVVPETLLASRPDSVQARIDLVVLDPATLSKAPQALSGAPDEVRAVLPSGVTATSELPGLVERVRAERRLLISGVSVGASQLIVLCCLALLLVASAAAADRRPESALAVLRGARWRHWAALAVGPTVVALLAAAVVGYGAGWLGAWAAWRWVFGEAGPPPATAWSLILAGATVAVLLAAAVGAEWRAHRGPLLDNLRRTAPRRRRWWLAGTDLIALALAGAAIYQIVAGTTTGGLALAAPILLALACGLLAGRLVLPLAARIGTALLHRGRLGGGLAALELARRPHGRPLLGVVTVAVALSGLGVCGVDTTGRAIDDRAAMELGADRVLTVSSTPAAVRRAVHAADPDGRWAMAASRLRVGTHTLVAVEADRLAAVANWPARGPDVHAVARELRPETNRPVTVTPGTLVLTATVGPRLDAPMRLILRMFEADGTPRDTGTVITTGPGQRDYRMRVTGCAAGCRLAWFAVPSSPERIRLRSLRLRDADGEREVLSPRDFSTPARWRPGFTTAPGELRLTHGEGWLTATYRPSDPRYIASELDLRLADSPSPLPVAAAGVRARETRESWLFGGGLRLIDPVTVADGLPGVAGDGFLFDHEYAERLAGDTGAVSGGEVWLARDTPPEVLAALRAALPVTGEQSAGQRAADLRRSGAGQSVTLYALAAVLGVGLAGAAVLAVAATDRRRRRRELRALRAQGLPAALGARSGLLSYAVLVGGGLVVGLGAAAANWWAAHRLIPVFGGDWVATRPPDLPGAPVTAVTFVAVAAVLLGCAWYAGHRLGVQHRGQEGERG